MSDPNPRRAGRKARKAARAAGPPKTPAQTGQAGGRYRPLSSHDVTAINATALRLLSDLGMGEVPDRLRATLKAAGAQTLANGRVSLPRTLVEEAIDHAPKTFPLHGRDPTRTIEVGGDGVHFCTGGAISPGFRTRSPT